MDVTIYITTMYRYGDREGHSYVLGAYDNDTIAIKEGDSEKIRRGNKYYPEVIEIVLNETKRRKVIYGEVRFYIK